MHNWPTHPVIYEVNTWVWLHDLAQEHGNPMTLDNIPEAELKRLADLNFDGIWLMGVWERSPAGCRIAREDPALQDTYRLALPDGYTFTDVVGSPYAIRDYRVDPRLGGDAALAKLRQQLDKLGLLLILDFVPNHLAIDHPWVTDHPDRFVQGSPASLQREPHNYFRGPAGNPPPVLAYGRDPHYAGWSDTIQLDYRRPETRQAMTDVLTAVAGRCDGLRCDMAMLVTRDVFLGTWGGEFDPPDADFWPAAISTIKARYPDFLMLAEVYWDMEDELQRFGFDYTYDKRLYDRLVHGDAKSVRDHLGGADPSEQGRLRSLAYQRHLARFVENHDEQPALTAFGAQRSLAAAALALLLPGLRLVHQGQIEGLRLKIPVQLARRHPEPPEPQIESFYRRLLAALASPVFHGGQWRLLEPREAWDNDPTYQNFVAYSWTDGAEYRLVAVNLAPHRSQCYIPWESPPLDEGGWHLCDMFSNREYHRSSGELHHPGLYLSLDGYDYHLFQLKPRPKELPPGIELRATFHEHQQGGGADKTILVQDTEDGGPPRFVLSHEDNVAALAWSPGPATGSEAVGAMLEICGSAREGAYLPEWSVKVPS